LNTAIVRPGVAEIGAAAGFRHEEIILVNSGEGVETHRHTGYFKTNVKKQIEKKSAASAAVPTKLVISLKNSARSTPQAGRAESVFQGIPVPVGAQVSAPSLLRDGDAGRSSK
jgi:hypothetical protein